MINTRPSLIPRILLATVPFLFGCATTKMESTVHTDASAHQFERVMVIVAIIPDEARELGEATFAEESTDGTTFIPSYPFLTLGEKHDDSEIAEILESHEVDAVLRLSLTGQGYDGSGTARSPNARFEAELRGIEDWVVVWSSTSKTMGNVVADGDDLLRSLARKTVEQLAEDGLIF
jgi:hypothetical protein